MPLGPFLEFNKPLRAPSPPTSRVDHGNFNPGLLKKMAMAPKLGAFGAPYKFLRQQPSLKPHATLREFQNITHR